MTRPASEQNTPPSWLALACRPGVVRRSALVALIVGLVLNLINQGDALLGGGPLNWWKIFLTFCVPYCVATYGAVSALRALARRR